jgi:hypothetical protein
MNTDKQFLLLQQQTLHLVMQQQQQLLKLYSNMPQQDMAAPILPQPEEEQKQAAAPQAEQQAVPQGGQQAVALPNNAPPAAQAQQPVPVRQSFAQCVSTMPWIPSPVEGLEIVTSFSNNFGKAIGTGLKSVCKPTFAPPKRKRSFKCEAPLWQYYFWSRFTAAEQKSRGAGRYGVFRAVISSSQRLHNLFGDGTFFRELKDATSFSFVAPKARAKVKWESMAAGTLKLEEADYVAVLAEVPDSDFVIAYHPCASNSHVEYQGKLIEGNIGYCDRSVLDLEVPVSLQYSPRTSRLAIVFPCWVFNAYGRMMYAKWAN